MIITISLRQFNLQILLSCQYQFRLTSGMRTFLPQKDGRIKIVALICFLGLSPLKGLALGAVPSGASPHELAYQHSKYIILARVISFERSRGLLIKVIKTLRGDTSSKERFYLSGTERFPFLNAPDTKLTLFINDIKNDEATLWQGPTTGGIIWGEHQTIAFIASAHAKPAESLRAAHPRERLSAAYFIIMGLKREGEGFSKEQRSIIMESLIWGLSQQEQATNQAALDALRLLGIDVQKLAGPYHPGFKQEIKEATAKRLKAWWNQKK